MRKILKLSIAALVLSSGTALAVKEDNVYCDQATCEFSKQIDAVGADNYEKYIGYCTASGSNQMPKDMVCDGKESYASCHEKKNDGTMHCNCQNDSLTKDAHFRINITCP